MRAQVLPLNVTLFTSGANEIVMFYHLMFVHILYVCYRAGTAKRRKNHLARVEHTKKKTLTGFQRSQGFPGAPGDLNCLSKTSFLIICRTVLKFMEHFLMDVCCFEREYFIFWLNRSMWCFGLLAYIFSPAAAKLSPEPLVLGLRSRCGPPAGPLYHFLPWSSTNCWENTHSRNLSAGVHNDSHVWIYFIQFGTLWACNSSHTGPVFSASWSKWGLRCRAKEHV